VSLGPAPRLDAHLFGEAPSRIVCSLEPAQWPRFERIVREWAVPVTVLGRVGGERLVIRAGERTAVTLGVDALAEAFHGTLERLVGAVSAQPSEDAA
jgi:phosphoribosylformylglycinamidine synthase